ncbi:MAG: PilZ domain-containing protein [Treponemataceae bacterium]
MKNCKIFVERRASKRYEVLVPCYVEGEPLLSFTMQNVSKGGCRLQVSSERAFNSFKKHNEYVLNVLPPHLSTKQIASNDGFSLTVDLRWSDTKNSSSVFGFKILKTDENGFDTWLGFIEKHNKEKKLPKKRLN